MPEIVAENTMAVPSAPPVETRAERLRNFWSDFRESWVAVGALIVIGLLLFLSFGAPLVSPQDPYDMAALDWLDAFLRPGTEGSGGYVHLLGTDNAGRDMLSAIFYGLRTSFVIGLSAGALALLVGIAVGLTAAYFGGRIEALLMRIVDLQLSMPAILLALVLLPILALVAGTAELAITFVFSAAYRPAAPILTVLIFTYAAYTIYITLVTALLAENRPGRALAIPLALLPVAVAAVWLGVSWRGAVGAALASFLNVASAATVVVGYVFYRFRPAANFRSLVRIALASAVIGGLARLWSPSGLVLILAYGLLGGLYLVLLLVLGEIRLQDLALVRTWLSHPKRGEGM